MGYGITVGHNAVEMLMRRAGLTGLPGNRRRRKRIIPVDTAVDLVDRNFKRTEPDQLWVTDITEHRTREGKVYCAVVLDVFSRRVVGWSIDASPTSSLVTALGMAIGNREPDGTVIHSDQGPQFTSWAFTNRARQSGLVPSMGSIGGCFDNAVVEAFWGRMQVELLKPATMADPHRTGQRHLRIPRGLPQPSATPLCIGDAHPDRIRENPPQQPKPSTEPPRVPWRLHQYERGWSPWDDSEGIQSSSGRGRCASFTSGVMPATGLMVA